MIGALVGWKGYAIAGAVSLAVGFGGGWKVRDAFADAAWTRRDLADAQEATNRAETALRGMQRSEAISAVIGEKSATRQIEIRNTTNEIVREVPRFISVEADREACPTGVPWGFVRLHDAAAAGRVPAVPDPAQPPNDAASGITTAAVAGTVTANYGTCHAELERLASLQAWINAQAADWNK